MHKSLPVTKEKICRSIYNFHLDNQQNLKDIYPGKKCVFHENFLFSYN